MKFILMRAAITCLCLSWAWCLSVVTAMAAPDAQASTTWIKLTTKQYQQSIRDIFGSSIVVTGRFEPDHRDQGLLAVGASRAGVSDAGLEMYDGLARNISGQIVSERNRTTLIPCSPKKTNVSDDACAKRVIADAGRLLFRRALTKDEVQLQVDIARNVTKATGDFYDGLAAALSNLLISPDFLFRFQRLEADRSHPGKYRLDGYSKAANLSFFLWNSTPDDQLLAAAERGELHTAAGLQRQVDRLLSSPNLETGVRAFFLDMLGFDKFETLSKDANFFPRFTVKVKEEAQEQTLRTIVDHLLVRQGDYRELLTTPQTFLTASLAALYGLPLADLTDNGQPDRWYPYRYADDDPRVGLLAQASFVALHSPSGRTSPTDRGKALREVLLCQTVPPPPANVEFQSLEDISNPKFKTTRDRLTAHRSDAVCAGCHRITDPIGLALENFDSSGGFRTTENGAAIDTSGDIRGKKFDKPRELYTVLSTEPSLTSCVAKRAYGFGTGRMPPEKDEHWAAILERFKSSNYNMVALLEAIATSDLFYSPPEKLLQAAASKE